MLKNYLTIALRNLSRSKVYSLINIFGLSLGVSCCLLLALYVQDELTYDRHHARVDDLYQITTHFDTPRHGSEKIATVSPPIAPALKNEIPEVEAATRLFPQGTNLMKSGDNIFYEADGFIVDSTIFDVLTYEFTEGNPKKSLTDANTVVITDKLSQKLFGRGRALNKLFSISQNGKLITFKVTGVMKDNNKTHFHANYFISITSEGDAERFRSDNVNGEWGGMNFVPSYVKLTSRHDKDEVVKKLNQVLLKYGSEDMKAIGFTKTLGLLPVKDIYLKSDFQKSPRITYLYVIVSIAVFILLIACINFMNLSTARATKRAAEFGVRKVMGAYRSSLISQILGEAMVNVLISIFLSVGIVQLILPAFNELIGKNISFRNENMSYMILALSVIAIFTGLVSGSYPAIYFSSLQPAQVLKGKFNMSNATGWLRRSLVVFQFVIAIVLVCGVIMISKQLKYLQEKDLGFNAEAKIVLPLRTQTAKAKTKALQSELNSIASIKQVSAADYMPGSYIWKDLPFYPQGGSTENTVALHVNAVDYGFQKLLGIKIIAGRGFTENREMESQSKVVVNKATVEAFGLDVKSAVGQKIYCEWQGEKSDFEIIGVMDDYHQTSLKDEIQPTLFEMPKEENTYAYLIASVNSENFDETVSMLEKTWNKLINDTPFEYSFLSESIQQQYNEDRRVSRIIASFTIIAMFISCLGLYGLSSYMAERRVKEIGMRKVMGASVNQIVSLMSKEFVKLVIVALIMAVPIAWYAMDKWLESFAYKTSIDALIFIYAGAAALIIAILTVSFESIKAATANPVNSLRSE